MRITGGKAARRILKAPKGYDVRPTPDLVKQALFNSLGAVVGFDHLIPVQFEDIPYRAPEIIIVIGNNYFLHTILYFKLLHEFTKYRWQ